MRHYICILICTFTALVGNTAFMLEKKHTMLCLGDSYTIGEAVDEKDRFPNQAVTMLDKQGIHYKQPTIIAKTGWTTDELADAIKDENLTSTYDIVTLLIGVNNQYRGRDTANYKQEFEALLNTAINYAGGNKNHVYVLSIPDWGQTPFAEGDKRSAEQIGKEIDAYNAVNKSVSAAHGVHYIDITDISREVKEQRSLIAFDNLHPSGRMYTLWAERLAAAIKKNSK